MVEKLKTTLAKSLIGAVPEQKATAAVLGLTRVQKAVEMSDNGAVRGMIASVRHLVRAGET